MKNYQIIRIYCHRDFNSKTSIPPSDYARLNEADISSICAMGHSTELNEINLIEKNYSNQAILLMIQYFLLIFKNASLNNQYSSTKTIKRMIYYTFFCILPI